MISKIQDSPNVNWFAFERKDEASFPNTIKTFMGRDALNIYLWNIQKNKSGQTALLPAYTCNEVTDQFKKYGYDIIFYDMKNFHITLEDIMPHLRDKSIDVFYFIHYFGMVQNSMDTILEEIKKVSKETIVIEDRAHYLLDKPKYESVNAITYSFRKLMAIPEGGGLYAPGIVDYAYKPKIFSNLLVFVMLAKKIILGHNPKFSRSKVMKDHGTPSKELMQPSTFSKNIIDNFDIEKHISLRRKLFYRWIDKLSSTSYAPVFDTLKSEDIPQGCPIYVQNAELVHTQMNEKGIYLKRHWPLDQELENIAPNAYILSEQVITLPIYEGINEDDMDTILKALQQLGDK